MSDRYKTERTEKGKALRGEILRLAEQHKRCGEHETFLEANEEV